MTTPRRRFWFGAYAGLLFMLTHWPRVALPVHNRSDLLVHMAVFGLWAALFCACAPFGPALSRGNVLRGGAVALVYSGVDEALQAIPFVRRVAAFDDAGANAAGVLLAVLVMLVLARRVSR